MWTMTFSSYNVSLPLHYSYTLICEYTNIIFLINIFKYFVDYFSC
jgi:hypothetical protein